MSGEKETSPSAEVYRGAERRIAVLTWVVGLAGAAVAFPAWSPAASAGIALGTVLAWVNGRWIAQATDAVARLSITQAGAEKPRMSPWVYVRFSARYGLIALVIYVMFARFKVPIVSVLVGLLALGLAAIIEGVYEAVPRSK